MVRIAVAGLINVETTLRVDAFPIPYDPVRYPFFGVRATVSGVGYNVAKALRRLSNEVRFCSMLGRDDDAEIVRMALRRDDIPDAGVLPLLEETPRSVILFDPSGRRQIHVDLKDIQERAFPAERFDAALEGADAAVLCNIEFARPLIARARARGIPIATDVHAIADLDAAYERDFLDAADVVFMSHERLPAPPEEAARAILRRPRARVVVVGLGAEGALLATREGAIERVPAVRTREVRNTIGGGDALFSSFLHAWLRSGDARAALERAVVYASWKVGAVGAADGLLTEGEWDGLCREAGRG